MSCHFLYRRGDGNEGNFIRAHIMLEAGDDVFAVLRALVLNDFIPGRAVRRHIAKHIELEGEECEPQAYVYEGPQGETAFGACWLTASLEPIAPEHVAQQMPNPRPWRELIDRSALASYGTHAGKRGQRHGNAI